MKRALETHSKRRVFYLIFLSLSLLTVNCNEEGTNANRVSICDDGVTGIGEDLEDFHCHEDKYNITYDFPAGYNNCTVHIQEPEHVCMSSPIIYNVIPPSSGAHRMIWPCYGEYGYCPPQRWVHSLEHGAVVFLYHPCTPDDQVTALKRLAKSCLWKHIITSYPHLDQQYPMALVSWGCVYRMSWVDVAPAEDWIRQHALHSPEGQMVQDGTYNHSLQQAATIVSDAKDSDICPKHHRTTTDGTKAPTSIKPTSDDITNPSSSLNNETSSSVTFVLSASELPDEKNYGTKSPSNHTSFEPSERPVKGISVLALTLISGTLAILVVLVMLCVLWRRYPPRRRHGRYKSFLPMSLQSDNGSIAIPTIGLPRSNKAETEILIPADEDDDEI